MCLIRISFSWLTFWTLRQNKSSERHSFKKKSVKCFALATHSRQQQFGTLLHQLKLSHILYWLGNVFTHCLVPVKVSLLSTEGGPLRALAFSGWTGKNQRCFLLQSLRVQNLNLAFLPNSNTHRKYRIFHLHLLKCTLSLLIMYIINLKLSATNSSSSETV